MDTCKMFNLPTEISTYVLVSIWLLARPVPNSLTGVMKGAGNAPALGILDYICFHVTRDKQKKVNQINKEYGKWKKNGDIRSPPILI